MPEAGAEIWGVMMGQSKCTQEKGFQQKSITGSVIASLVGPWSDIQIFWNVWWESRFRNLYIYDTGDQNELIWYFIGSVNYRISSAPIKAVPRFGIKWRLKLTNVIVQIAQFECTIFLRVIRNDGESVHLIVKRSDKNLCLTILSASTNQEVSHQFWGQPNNSGLKQGAISQLVKWEGCTQSHGPLGILMRWDEMHNVLYPFHAKCERPKDWQLSPSLFLFLTCIIYCICVSKDRNNRSIALLFPGDFASMVTWIFASTQTAWIKIHVAVFHIGICPVQVKWQHDMMDRL